jgi:fucose 4-O-acetylase-like acetyltransferase
MQQGERQAWIDVARGIGVILVVYGHVLGGLVGAGLFPAGPGARWMNFGLYTFHMPLFFLLAGLNVPHSLQRGAGPFLTSKLWTLAYPYLLWSLIQGSIILVAAHDVNTPVTVGDLLAIPYRPMAQFWFLYALLICHLLAAALLPNRMRLLACVAAAGFLAFQFVPARSGLPLTLHHLPLYVAGIWASSAIVAWRVPGRWPVAALIWGAFAVAVALAGPVSGFDEQALVAVPACVLGIAGVVWVSKLVNGGWLAVVGRQSMTIYVLHILAAAGTRIVLVHLHVAPQPVLYLVAGTVVGVGLPMAAHVVMSRIGLLPLLGLAPHRSRQPAERAIAYAGS